MSDPRDVVVDLLEALKMLKRGQIIVATMASEPGLPQCTRDMCDIYIVDCQRILDKYPNAKL